MKLSFFPEGTPDCPLLMISNFSADEVALLKQAAGDLANGIRDRASLDQCLGSDREFKLRLGIAERNIGILNTPPEFECRLKALTWSNVEGLLQPFLSGNASGFQWLDDSGEVTLLISCDGTW